MDPPPTTGYAQTQPHNAGNTHAARAEPPRILLVEDNPGDVSLFMQALAEAGFCSAVSVAPNGDEALACLRGEGRWTAAPPPDLVLLDLHLPGKSGHEVLREIKGDPKLRTLPVIVVSSSDSPRDLALAYDLHANCYVRKPFGFPETLEVVTRFAAFWLAAVSLPPRPARQSPRPAPA